MANDNPPKPAELAYRGQPPGAGMPYADEHLALAWNLFLSLENQIQRADQKVQAIFGVNALLVAALSFQGQASLASLKHGPPGLGPIVLLLCEIVVLSLVCLGTLAAIFALRPRVRREEGDVEPIRSSVFFFGHIGQRSASEMCAEFLAMTEAEAIEQILRQSHAVSRILVQKYKWSERAIEALTASLVAWVLLLNLRFVL